MLHQLSPGTAALLFSAPEGSDPTATVDGQLYARAKERNLRIAALETIEEQLAVFQQLPDPQAIAALTEALDEVDAGRPDDRKLLDAYAAGDDQRPDPRRRAGRLRAFTRQPGARQSPALRPQSRHGCAPGAVPCPGRRLRGDRCRLLSWDPKSVIELLRARGYKITRVP